MAECEIPLPCSSTISSFDTALEIINTGRGGAMRGIQDNVIPGEGVYGFSRGGIGVRGMSGPHGTGVIGESQNAPDFPSTGTGVSGHAEAGIGVLGKSEINTGVSGEGGKFGVLGSSETGNAGFFEIGNGDNDKTALHAHTRGKGSAVEAIINTANENDRPALRASTNSSGVAVDAENTGSGRAGKFSIRNRDNIRSAVSASTNGKGVAVFALSASGIGVVGGGGELAGLFLGDIDVTGNVAAGSKTFVIDHPLDPANKYLIHSTIESSEMMNVYSGNAVLDENGEAWVKLEPWFEALNGDFRYQLTCVGGFAPIYVAQEVQHNQFKIAGGSHRMRVSWQLTGVRKDPWAQTHPLVVEKEKSVKEKGYYRHPELYGQAPENSTFWANNTEKMHD
jgi:hypothetical protein